MLTQIEKTEQQIKCILCDDVVSHSHKDQSKYTTDNGIVDVFYSPDQSSLLVFGLCTSCTTKSVQNKTLIRVAV